MRNVLALVTGALALVFFAAAPAAAQQAEAAPAEAAAAADIDAIESIVVTITKREESVQEVGGAIAAFDAQTIESANIENVGDLIGLLPNVQVKGEDGDISVRGISAAFGTLLSPVSQHVNGMYKVRNESYFGQFYDLESVQVALGPSGTLYGRNGTAGAIDIRWRRPQPEYEIFGDMQYAGPYKNWQVRGGANFPLSETLMLRTTGIFEVQDAWVENTAPGAKDDEGIGAKDDSAVRAELLWEASPDLEISFRGKYVSQGKDYDGGPLIDPNTRPEGRFGVQLDPRLPPNFFTIDWTNGLQQFRQDLLAVSTLFAEGPTRAALAPGQPGRAALEAGVRAALPPGTPESAALAAIQGAIEGQVQQAIANTLAGFEAGFITGHYRNTDPEAWPLQSPIDFPQGDKQSLATRITELGEGKTTVRGWDLSADWALHDLPIFGDVNVAALFGHERVADHGYFDSDGTILQALDTLNIQDPDKWYTGELRATSENDYWLNWSLGVFHLNQTFRRRQYTFTPLPDRLRLERTRSEALGVFGNIRVNPIEAVELTAGVRRNRDEVRSNERRWNINPVDCPDLAASCVAGMDPTVSDAAEDTFRETTMDLGGKWFINEDHMLYAKWARGYKAGFIELNPLVRIAPERVLATEGGWKSTWQDGALRFNVSGFHYKYNDQQTNVVYFTETLKQNADELTMWGFEAELQMNPTEEWFMRAVVGYLNAEYDKFCSVDPLNVDPRLFSATPADAFDPGCEQFVAAYLASPASVPRVRDLSGNTPEDAPEFKFSLLTNYIFDLGENGVVTPTLEFTWTDDMYRRPFNIDVDRIDAHTKTDLRVRWENQAGSYFAELFAENLEDEIIYPRLIATAQTGTAVGYGILQPRTFGVRVGFHWGDEGNPLRSLAATPE